MTDHKQLIERLTYKSSEFFSNAYRAAGQGIADEQQQRALHSYVVLGESVKARSAQAILSLITERDERAQEAEDLGEQANRWRNEYGVWRERAETAEAQRDELREALAGIKWRSGDKDNMEFVARITCFQMDAIRKLAALHNTTNHGESNG